MLDLAIVSFHKTFFFGYDALGYVTLSIIQNAATSYRTHSSKSCTI